MAKYIKTAVTEAEQFDGSQQLVDKYEILVGSTMFNGYVGEPSLCYIQTLEGNLRIHVGDWIATGVNGERWAVTDEIFKQTYTKLPKVPSFVANHIGFSKHINQGFNSSVLTMVQDIYDWYDKNGELYARAWLDGYEIDNKS